MRRTYVLILVSLLIIAAPSCAPLPCATGNCYQAQRQTALRSAQVVGRSAGTVLSGRPRYYRGPFWAIEPGYNSLIDNFVFSATGGGRRRR